MIFLDFHQQRTSHLLISKIFYNPLICNQVLLRNKKQRHEMARLKLHIYVCKFASKYSLGTLFDRTNVVRIWLNLIIHEMSLGHFMVITPFESSLCSFLFSYTLKIHLSIIRNSFYSP